jgi:hypothetical protein
VTQEADPTAEVGSFTAGESIEAARDGHARRLAGRGPKRQFLASPRFCPHRARVRDPLAPISSELPFGRSALEPSSEAAQLCVMRSVGGSWALMRVRRIDGPRVLLHVAALPSTPATRAQVGRLMDAIVSGFSGSLLTHVGVCVLGRTVVEELSSAARRAAHIPASLFFLDLAGAVRRTDGHLAAAEPADAQALVFVQRVAVRASLAEV